MQKAKLVYLFLGSIVAISLIGNLYLFEIRSTESIGLVMKALLIASWISAIAIIGILGCKYLNCKWAELIWILNYVFAIATCSFYLCLFICLKEIPPALKQVLITIRNFYLTPFPFALLLMLSLSERSKN